MDLQWCAIGSSVSESDAYRKTFLAKIARKRVNVLWYMALRLSIFYFPPWGFPPSNALARARGTLSSWIIETGGGNGILRRLETSYDFSLSRDREFKVIIHFKDMDRISQCLTREKNKPTFCERRKKRMIRWRDWYIWLPFGTGSRDKIESKGRSLRRPRGGRTRTGSASWRIVWRRLCRAIS